MKIPTDMPDLKGFRFPRALIAYVIWAYHRFSFSTADVEDLYAERRVAASRETVRLWVNRFGRPFASCIKRDRPGHSDKWHLDMATRLIFWSRSSAMQRQPGDFYSVSKVHMKTRLLSYRTSCAAISSR